MGHDLSHAQHSEVTPALLWIEIEESKKGLIQLRAALGSPFTATASANNITENLSFGGTQLGTVKLTQGGSCNGSGISSTSVCVDVQMTTGTVRLGGPVIGFSGNVNVNGTTMVSGVSVGSLSIGTACGGIGMQDICLETTGSATTTSLFLVLSNADTTTEITVGNVHVAGAFCGGDGTCFATSTPVTSVPEPGTLSLLGTGLVGLAAFARRRFCC